MVFVYPHDLNHPLASLAVTASSALAIAGQLQRVFVRLLFQKLQIHPAIIIHEEHILAVVAALRDMMGESNCYCSG